MVHTRNGYNIVDLFQDFGGMQPLIFFVCEFLALAINSRVVVAKYIRSIYFQINNESQTKNIKFNVFDKFIGPIAEIVPCFCLTQS
jgi:hypothetical protein